MQGGLGNIATGVTDNALGKFGPLRRRTMGSNQHTVAPRLTYCFDHQFIEVANHVLALIRITEQVRFDVVDDGVLATIVANHCRYIGIQRFVVGHSRAQGIGDGHIAGPVRM